MSKYLFKISSEINHEIKDLIKNYLRLIENNDEFMINLIGISELSLQSLQSELKEEGFTILKEWKMENDELYIKLKRK